MVWMHPVLQVLATLVGLYALYLGRIRFQTAHLGRKAVFPWKAHIQWGAAALFVWAGAPCWGWPLPCWTGPACSLPACTAGSAW